MKILVTGGGGFLGTHIVKQLLEKDYEVTSLSRHSYSHLEELGVSTLKVDLTQEGALDEINLDEFEAIFHVAAMAGVWGSYVTYHNINYKGAINLLNASKKSKVKYFIYTSTPSVVFGKDDIVNGDENLTYPDKFYTHYAKTKAMAEKEILENSFDDFQTAAIRPHLIWGPGDPHILPRLVERAKEGKLKMVGDGQNLVDIIYVENAASAHIQLFEKMKAGEKLGGNAYFVGQERPVKLWEFINQLLSLSNAKPAVEAVSFDLAFKLGFIFEFIFKLIGIRKPEPPMTRFVALQLAKSHYFSHDKAKKHFGYTPKVTIEEGLERTFANKVKLPAE